MLTNNKKFTFTRFRWYVRYFKCGHQEQYDSWSGSISEGHLCSVCKEKIKTWKDLNNDTNNTQTH